MDIELVWHGGQRPDLDEVVKADLQLYVFDGLEPGEDYPAENICFHHVFLTPSLEGPSVLVWGEKGDPRFHCDYTPVTEWGEPK